MTPKQLSLLECKGQIEAAYEILRSHAIPYTNSYEAFQAMLEGATRQPDEDDLKWLLTEVPDITAHLVDQPEERPMLGCAIAIGRSYALSPAQRDVIRSWFNMTPAPLVEVVDLALFPDTKVIQYVVLRSCEHIDPRRRRVVNKFTIDRWGRFCQQVQTREIERAQQVELDALTARVETLFQRAKEEGVEHRQRTAGGLAHKLQAEVEVFKVQQGTEMLSSTDLAAKVREIFRNILIQANEHGLAKLVREPKNFPDAEAKKPGQVKVKALDLLANEYGVQL